MVQTEMVAKPNGTDRNGKETKWYRQKMVKKPPGTDIN